MTRIELQQASLCFRVRQQKRIGFKDFLLGHMFRPSLNPIIEVKALQKIDLEVRDGSRIGLLGHNGAGKSTLLKLLAGIYPATSGRVRIEGQISSLLDIGVGVESDASGWDNIMYGLYLQGDTPAQMQVKRERIADFSELGHKALQMPVRFYSSGMLVRLLFSIATEVNPDILLVDEVLGAGDLSFQDKARKRMLELIARARVLVIASHDLNALRELCDRVLWLDHGEVKLAGSPDEVIPLYQEYMTRRPVQVAA